MKKIILTGTILVMLAGFAWAMGGFMMPEILSKSPVVKLKGKVTQVGINSNGWMHRRGIMLETSNGVVKVYGLGPIGYWNQNNATLQNGDTISVTAYKLNVNGEIFYVAKDVTLANGKTIQLRDNKGYPVWRGHGRMMMQNGNNGHMMHDDCLDMMNNNHCPHMMNQMNHQ